ncbi:rRNA-processing protein cgr1 [Fusarium falciforme]
METNNLQRWSVTEPYLNLHCELGEGLYYERATQSIRFVDILKKQLHTVSLAKGPASVTSITLNETISVTADIEGYDPSDKVLAGLKYGIAVLDRKYGSYEYLSRFEETPNARVRSNDGAIDPNGKLWLGTMTDFDLGPFQSEGRVRYDRDTTSQSDNSTGGLYKFDGSLPAKPVISNLTVPNSIGWSPDHKILYYTHTTTRQVFEFDFSVSASTISNQRVFYTHAGPGFPDGFRVDVDGNVWHAIYGEGKVLRISPDGKVTGEVLLPTLNITCVEFVGTEMFVTTAGDDSGNSRSRELGGALFRVDIGAEGMEHFLFKIT